MDIVRNGASNPVESRQRLSRFLQRDLCKSILEYLPPTPDDVQHKQLAFRGFQLDVKLTHSLKNIPKDLNMVLKGF